MWKDKDKTRLFGNTNNIVYDYRGTLPKKRDMAGFEKDRNTLKYRCPMQAYGISCENCEFKKGLRINISENRRLFAPQ